MSSEKDSEKGEISFEERINRLEEIVQALEDGEAPLEASLKLFEEGIELAQACQDQLETARERVQVLLETAENGKVSTELLDDKTEG